MADNDLQLPWGSDWLTIALPREWHIAGILEPGGLPAIDDVSAEVLRSLQQPNGVPRLHAMVRKLAETQPEPHVAIVIDDASRPTPVARILPLVLRELEDAGVRRDHVTLVTAVGLHRPMTESEVAGRAGASSLSGLRWENHDCDDASRLVSLGTTSRGTQVLVNKTVVESNLVVSIGCIEPHIIASFGGGYKNLVPGVAGRMTVAHNHSLNCAPATFNMVGQAIERNPMRLDLEEAGGMLLSPVFIVNAVHDLRQGVKALANTIRAVRVGGVHVTLVRANEGVGVFGLANRKLPLGRLALQRLAPLLLLLVPRLKLKGLGEEDRFFLYFALQAMRHGVLSMHAPTIPVEIQAQLPFVQFAASADAALLPARRRFPGRAEVLVFPHGGSTYPAFPS